MTLHRVMEASANIQINPLFVAGINILKLANLLCER